MAKPIPAVEPVTGAFLSVSCRSIGVSCFGCGHPRFHPVAPLALVASYAGLRGLHSRAGARIRGRLQSQAPRYDSGARRIDQWSNRRRTPIACRVRRTRPGLSKSETRPSVARTRRRCWNSLPCEVLIRQSWTPNSGSRWRACWASSPEARIAFVDEPAPGRRAAPGSLQKVRAHTRVIFHHRSHTVLHGRAADSGTASCWFFCKSV